MTTTSETGSPPKCPDCGTPLVDRTGVILWCPKCQLAFPMKDFLEDQEVIPVVTPKTARPPTVQLASLPRQWRAEAGATSPGASADLGDTSDVRRVAYAGALLDCAQELQQLLSISPRGCWEHPGIPGYQHPECGFCWHGKDGLDVPTVGHGANQEPSCPRCHPQLPSGHVAVRREDLRRAVPRYDADQLADLPPLLRESLDRLSAAAGDPQ